MNAKKYKKLALIAVAFTVAIASSAFTTTALLATRQMQLIGPFWRSSMPYDSLTAGQAGGRAVVALNGEASDSMRIGQVVFWSDTNEVSLSATLADYNKIAGVVIGGASTSMQTGTAIADTSTLAAVPGAKVILCVQCRTWVLNDANGAIAAGERIIPSNATQGRAEIITTAIDSNYRAIGKAVIASAASKAILTEVNIK